MTSPRKSQWAVQRNASQIAFLVAIDQHYQAWKQEGRVAQGRMQRCCSRHRTRCCAPCPGPGVVTRLNWRGFVLFCIDPRFGVVGTIAADAGQRFIGRNWCKKRGEHRRITHAVVSHWPVSPARSHRYPGAPCATA